MLNRIMAFGIRDWHAFWTPVKAWADHHQDHNGNALQFFASLVTVIGLPLMALLIVATLVFLLSDRRDARRHRAMQRRTILVGLKAELKGTRETASQDAMAFALGTEGTWTILPHTSVELAAMGAGLLDLTLEQIIALHELRLRILRANSLVSAQLAVPPLSNRGPGGPSGASGDRLGGEIRGQFEAITGLCDNLLACLESG
jgi:hypothetical protein